MKYKTKADHERDIRRMLMTCGTPEHVELLMAEAATVAKLRKLTPRQRKGIRVTAKQRMNDIRGQS